MCVNDCPDGATIKVKVTPRSSKNAVVGIRGDGVAVKLTTPPVEGRANKDLIKFIAKKLGVSPSSVTILKGDTSREKVLLVRGADAETTRSKLGVNG
jgi:uncharacterized protein